MATSNKPVSICPECKANNTQHKCEKCGEYVCAICCMHRGLENVFRCKKCHEDENNIRVQQQKREKSSSYAAVPNTSIIDRFENEFQNHSETLEDLVNAANLLVTGNEANIGHIAASMDDRNEEENDVEIETAKIADEMDCHEIQELAGEAEVDEQLIEDLREACIADSSKKNHAMLLKIPS